MINRKFTQGSNEAIRDRELRIVFYMFQIKHSTSLTFHEPYITHMFQKKKKKITLLKLTKLQGK